MHAAFPGVLMLLFLDLVGGLATSFLLELLVYPAIYLIWKSRELPQAAASSSRAALPVEA